LREKKIRDGGDTGENQVTITLKIRKKNAASLSHSLVLFREPATVLPLNLHHASECDFTITASVP
jgi:hypothetical protein